MDSDWKEVKIVRKMEEGAICRPEVPIPHNKCEHANVIKHFYSFQEKERILSHC